MTRVAKGFVFLLLAAWSGGAGACVLGAVYNLPIPFGMYASGAGAALVVSFIVVAFVLRAPAATGNIDAAPPGSRHVSQLSLPRWVISSASCASLFGLLLTIVTGLLGSANPLANFNMTFFWIIFWLGLTYITALLGDLYSLANPWRALCGWLEHASPGIFRGRFRYPAWFGYYPALVLYATLIWTELFGQIQPRTLSLMLLGYTGLNVAAAWVVGKDIWFRYGEFFSVFFRLIGKMAPIEYSCNSDGDAVYGIRIRRPFVGLLEVSADHFSLLLFVVFMLSSTAFDGAHETVPWVGMFWKGIYPIVSDHIVQPYLIWVSAYYIWQSAMLLLLPLCYLAVYLILLWLARTVTHSGSTLPRLALRFAFTLIPIAFVYNMTHYYGEFASQGIQVLRMVSDPFSFGWNLFGTAHRFTDPIVLDAGAVWHTQVGLILFGHIASVYLAHVEALKVFPSARHAVLSQLPMLLLMVLLTTAGLWILSLPIDAGQLSTPL
jgi:hypothetical protein